MCGRYVLVMGEDGMAQLIREQDIPRDWMVQLVQERRVLETSSTERPSFTGYNIAPTHRAPIVISRDGARHIELARWGFVPQWWSEASLPKFATFNAREDKLKESGLWRGSLDRHRCLVPASGFYEWKRVGKERRPYYIHRKDGELMAFAGLYSHWKAPGSDKASATFTIITTPTNRLMEPLHDRIPLVLGGISDELWSVWLDPQTSFADVERHVASREWPEMTMHSVSTEVNATGKGKYVDGPRLIEALPEQESPQEQLF